MEEPFSDTAYEHSRTPDFLSVEGDVCIPRTHIDYVSRNAIVGAPERRVSFGSTIDVFNKHELFWERATVSKVIALGNDIIFLLKFLKVLMMSP